MLKYTLAIIKRGQELLLLNRVKAPNMGMWNGLGGKIEPGETPTEGVIREIYEEAGIRTPSIQPAGEVIWESNNGNQGMYLFALELDEHVEFITPIRTDEGVLEWKTIDWILHPDNRGVVDNMRAYLPYLLKSQFKMQHRFIYQNHQLVAYEAMAQS